MCNLFVDQSRMEKPLWEEQSMMTFKPYDCHWPSCFCISMGGGGGYPSYTLSVMDLNLAD